VSGQPPPWGPIEPPGGQPQGSSGQGSSGQGSSGTGWGTPGWGTPGPGSPAPWGARPAGWGDPGYQAPVTLPKGGDQRTGPLPLHPMTVGDVLDGAFKLLRANLVVVVLVTAAIQLPLDVVAAYLQRDLFGGVGLLQLFRDPSLGQEVSPFPLGSIPQLGGVLFIELIVRQFMVPFLVGCALAPVVMASYAGQQVSAGQALGQLGRRLPLALVAFACVHLLELVGFLLCLLPALIPMAFFALTAPAFAVERLGPINAMARSASLAAARFWPVLGVSLLAGLIAYFVDSALGWVFQLPAQLIGLHTAWPLLAVGTLLPALVTMPFIALVATLLYLDARIRLEGLDLQLAAANLNREARPAR
jgi:hypothetical protein